MGSIRLRILKVNSIGNLNSEKIGYSGFDPIEDTESHFHCGNGSGGAQCYSGFDPIEERWRSPDCLRCDYALA